MNVDPRLLKRVVSVLLAAALALSPVAAFAGHQDMAGTHPAATDEMPPCDMPCDDCADDEVSPACAIACSGLIAAIPAPPHPMPQSTAMRVRVISSTAAAGHEREPDKPPPRRNLA
jgi:hypothetical protein